ncbi:hypothetical protein EYF80_013764 [Liparis tanakae]|uniref:Uncharacterized protein n=1 Tax=Liparis tanakae TaxID=230148 RepID=A0A4Z2IE20_9TELE|nr:hypothetical protein EYF80_013764 [Liparis tanakae]
MGQDYFPSPHAGCAGEQINYAAQHNDSPIQHWKGVAFAKDSRGWSGAVYVARRPDLFQLCPGRKTFSPVRLDSLDIHRGRWKTGGLHFHVGYGELGEGGVLSQEQGVLYYFGTTRTRHLLMRACGDLKFIIWQTNNESQDCPNEAKVEARLIRGAPYPSIPSTASNFFC